MTTSRNFSSIAFSIVFLSIISFSCDSESFEIIDSSQAEITVKDTYQEQPASPVIYEADNNFSKNEIEKDRERTQEVSPMEKPTSNTARKIEKDAAKDVAYENCDNC